MKFILALHPISILVKCTYLHSDCYPARIHILPNLYSVGLVDWQQF